MSHAWAQSTQESYSSDLLSWHVYCDKKLILDLQQAPASQPHLATFVANLARCFSGRTISNYLHGIHTWHILHGMEWKLNKVEMDALLKGAERLTPESSKWKKRQPYTPKFMSIICQHLNLDDPFNAASFTCLTTCFYTAVWVGKLTILQLNTFNIAHHITLIDHCIENNQYGTKVPVLHIPRTKTAPIKGEDIFWSRQHSPTDPHVALENHRHINVGYIKLALLFHSIASSDQSR